LTPVESKQKNKKNKYDFIKIYADDYQDYLDDYADYFGCQLKLCSLTAEDGQTSKTAVALLLIFFFMLIK
jgi:hypothetical protein